MFAALTRAPYFRTTLFGVLALLFLLLPGEVRASSSDLNTELLQFCTQNAAEWDQTISDSKSQDATVPVPPEINPPCEACTANHSNSGTYADTQTDAFVAASEQPELDETKFLLMVDTFLALRGGNLSENQVQLDISPPALRCMSRFNQPDAETAAYSLMKRLFNKKLDPMAERYDGQPKRAYAGIKLLSDGGRLVAMVSGFPPPSAGEPDTTFEAKQIQAMLVQDMQTWAQTVVDASEHATTTFAYNLCPAYVQMLRMVQLLGGSAALDPATITKMENFLHFDVTMDLHITGKFGGKGHIDASWEGKTTLRVTGLTGTCYTPELDSNGLAFTRQSFTLEGNGTSVDLVGPSSFNVPVAWVNLSLCDNTNPQLQMHFTSFGPGDALEAQGHSVTANFFQSNLRGAINTPIENKFLNGGSGAASSSSGGSSDTSTSSSSNSSSSGGSATPTPKPSPTPNAALAVTKQELNQVKALILAHKSDPSWLTGSQGQAAIAQMQTLANQAATEATAGSSGGSSASQIVADVDTLMLSWTNGSQNVVDQTQTFTEGGLTVTLHVTGVQKSK